MWDRLHLVCLLLASCLIVSAAATNRTDDTTLFSSSSESVSARGNHTGTTATPNAVKHLSKIVEEHSKASPSTGSNHANSSLEASGHKGESTKLELPKSTSHGASNSTKTEAAHSSASNKLETTKSANHSVSSVKIEAQKSTTLAPSATATEKVTSSIKHAISNSVSTSSKSESQHGHANETIHKFCDYLKPICDSVDKILPKALFKIQTQFKQFVHLTSGKLSLCFLENYSFDPNLKPVTVTELKTLCSSKSSSSNSRGSYKAFANCAATNWNPAVDKELDRIIEARLNCSKNHQHSKSNTTNTGSLDHESEDEVSIINDVVSKVLDGDKSAGSGSKTRDIEILDLSGSTTSKPGSGNSTSSKQVHKETSASTSAPSKVKNLLNDPNTVVVFVDDSKTTTKKPTTSDSSSKSKIEVAAKSSDSSTTLKPDVVRSTVKFELPSHVKLSIGLNKQASTAAPSTINKTTSVTSSLAHKLTSSERTSTSAKPTATTTTTTTTTSKPSSSSSTTKKVSTVTTEATKSSSNKVESLSKAGNSSIIKVITSASSPAPTPLTKPPPKPLESIGELMRRQEKEKSEFEMRLKAEREKVFKQLQKKQDEFEAQNAIKALQVQREASASHSSDNRLHQLEHERQMTIDPLGHTMKHQQYEMSKQQRVISGKV